MARTDLVATEMLGAYGNYAAGAAGVTMAAADVANGNQFRLEKNDLLLAYNSGGVAYTITITSVADRYGRTRDISAYSIGAGEWAAFGHLLSHGWQQEDKNIYASASNSAVKLGILRQPIGGLGIPPAEYHALMWLYESTSGDNWTDNSNWGDLTVPIDDWYGITVSSGRVTQISLNSNGLNGSVGGFPIEKFTGLTQLNLGSNANVVGDVSGWNLPGTLEYLYLQSTGISGDISGWTLPSALTTLHVYSTGVSGDICSGWTLPAGLDQLSISSTSVSGNLDDLTINAALTELLLAGTDVGVAGPTSVGNATGIEKIAIHGNELTQSEVDQICLDIYGAWAGFTYATPVLTIGGNNAVPSGSYADEDPPATGQGAIYEICEDPEITGNETWTVTYRANGGDITKP